MSNLRLRIKALESLMPIKTWFTIDINGEATAAEWELINEAHDNGRTVYIFQSQGDTLGVYLVGADCINWSDK
jgi:hypothetical protein